MVAVRKIEEFVAGRTEKGAGYHYFIPEPINFQWQWEDAQLTALLEKAALSLGELNSFARLVPNVDLFIQLHVTKEAVVSSRIEGTRTNVEEALLLEEEVSPERRDDWVEVNNYTQAMQTAISELENLPLSSRLLRQTHAILLSGVRGERKLPGTFRTSQNWIGGATPSDAIFVPPAHTYINELMGDLENFLHNTDIHVPALIRIGLAHYQFETIHPFLDGNGRIGRLLITLYLVSEKILHQPLLYLSTFFEQNKTLYYDNLNRVREKNDLLQWLKYFLVGVDQTSRHASQTLSQVMQIKTETEELLRRESGRRAQSAITLLHFLFQNPVVRVRQVEKYCGLSTKAANDLVSFFREKGILQETNEQARNRVFVFQRYLGLFR
jgi:Fic family protein